MPERYPDWFQDAKFGWHAHRAQDHSPLAQMQANESLQAHVVANGV